MTTDILIILLVYVDDVIFTTFLLLAY